MIKPEFPFRGNQLILSSDRLVLHSKTDAIFLFGNGAVSLSSLQTINLDSKEKVLIDSPKIELGHRAEQKGEPVIMGIQLNTLLLQLLKTLVFASSRLSTVSESNLGSSMQSIASAGQSINETVKQIASILESVPQKNPIFSKTTFTT